MTPLRRERRHVLITNQLDLTGDLERDALLSALTAIEQREGERLGWDQPPRLWEMYMPNAGRSEVLLQVLPPSDWRRYQRHDPVEDLELFTSHMPDPPTDLTPVSFADSPAGFAGFALMTEAWAPPTGYVLTDDEIARAGTGERVITNRPDRVEVRMIIAVDISGRAYMLHRDRGGAVEYLRQGEPDTAGSMELTGRVPRALRRMTHTIRTGTLGR